MLIQISKPRGTLTGAAGAALVVVLFCLHLLRGNPGIYFNDDYQISILPVFADVARAWGEGHWPLLSPYSWACGNLAGEYQYGTFSVFVNAVVVAIWKFSLTLPQRAAALSITHLAVLAVGSYLLARVRKLPGSLSTSVAIIAALNGWEMGWGATDWFGALAAHAWLPWCWWAFEVALLPPHEENGKHGQLRFLLPIPCIYLLLSAGFPYSVVMLGLTTVWLALRTWWEGGPVKRIAWALIFPWCMGLMLSAPAWLSLLEAVHGSGRSQHGVGTGNLAWTVPVAALPGLILPNWTNQWPDFANQPCTHGALELAGGFVPTVGLVAALGCLGRKALRALRWDLGLLGAVLLLCLLPSPGLFRWSFRWLPLLHLVLALTGAKALHLLASRTRGWQPWRNPGCWATGIVALTWSAMRLAHTSNPDPLTDGIAPCMLIISCAWAGLAMLSERRGWRLWAVSLATLAGMWGTYRFAHTNTGLPIYPTEGNLAEIAPLSPERLYLSCYREPDQFYRVWQVPPAFGAVVRMGSMGLYAGVRMINGYSPIMSEGVGKEFGLETHGNVPEVTGERLFTQEAGTDGLLARLGVDAIIVTHDYQTPARPPGDVWIMRQTFDEGDVYQRRDGFLERVRSWKSAEPGAPDEYAHLEIKVIEDSRQRVECLLSTSENQRPGLIAFSRPFYPGYRATLNGISVPVGSFRGLMPTVQIPAGASGRLVLTYLPNAIIYGGILAAAALLFVMINLGRILFTKG